MTCILFFIFLDMFNMDSLLQQIKLKNQNFNIGFYACILSSGSCTMIGIKIVFLILLGIRSFANSYSDVDLITKTNRYIEENLFVLPEKSPEFTRLPSIVVDIVGEFRSLCFFTGLLCLSCVHSISSMRNNMKPFSLIGGQKD